MIPLATFVLCYICFMMFGKQRAFIAMGGAIFLLLARSISIADFFILVHWNVVGLLRGTLILAELFMQSYMPAVLAEWVVDKTKTARGAIIAIIALSSAISIFVENVAVVLLIAPVALKLCEKINISPVKPLIFLAIFSNIQGSATLIGDPPSMILAGYLNMNFIDFFFFQGKIGIFFFVQAGAIAALLMAAWLLRRQTESIQIIAVEKARSFFPTILLIMFIILLSFGTYIDPKFQWYAGTMSIALAILGMLWYLLGPHWTSVKTLFSQLDWDTTFFLIGVFVLVGAVIRAGWVSMLAEGISTYLAGHILWTYVIIIIFSIVVSAFVDNIPYLMAMLPVVQKIAADIEAPLPLLMFALLIGSCLGGNISPIGASANIVATGTLQKKGWHVPFFTFVRLGFLLTLAATAISSVFLWFVWKP